MDSENGCLPHFYSIKIHGRGIALASSKLEAAPVPARSQMAPRHLKLIVLTQANTSKEVYEEVRSILAATRRRGLDLSGQSDMSDEKAACLAKSFADKLEQVTTHSLADRDAAEGQLL